ncbi:MAG: hypothetical protein AAFN30_04785, partial [Actinomycetota bacterium]
MVAVLGVSVALIGSFGSDSDALDATSADIALATAASSASSTGGSVDNANLVALPASSSGVDPLVGPARVGSSPARSGGTLAAPASSSPDTTGAESSTTAAPSTSAAPASQPQQNNDNKNNDYDDPTKANGYDVHGFVEHVVPDIGAQMLAPGQQAYGGYQLVEPGRIQGQSTLTGLRPVIEQAITDVVQKNPNAQGQELERKVAKRLTELNDWKNLNSNTKEKMMLLSGVDIQGMDKRLREDTINHLQHSPLSFGDVPDVLTPNTVVDIGYTHTLDKNWTQAAHLGDGVFQIWYVSNNNNGSHTGHIMGSIRVQLSPTTSISEAKKAGNRMLQNKNNNNKLYLDEAARKVLTGETPWLDYSHLSPEEKRAAYVGRPYGSRPVVSPRGPEPEPEPTTTTTEAPTTTDAPEPTEDPTTTESSTPEPESTTSTTQAEDPSTTESTPAEENTGG